MREGEKKEGRETERKEGKEEGGMEGGQGDQRVKTSMGCRAPQRLSRQVSFHPQEATAS